MFRSMFMVVSRTCRIFQQLIKGSRDELRNNKASEKMITRLGGISEDSTDIKAIHAFGK